MADQVVSSGSTSSVARAGTGFLTGVGFLLRGLAMYARSPKLMVLGLVPALLSFVVLAALFVGMVLVVDDAAAWLTPFAADWSSGWRDTTRVVVMIAIAGLWTVLSFVVFTALTLIIGQPFYEAISKRVEDRLGGVPNEIDVSFWRTLPRTVGESIRMLVFAAFFGALIFPIGFIPVIGQIVAPLLGATLGGWVLALELTSVPFERRGLKLEQRRSLLKAKANRPMAMGLGVATFVCFLVPLGAVIVMPAAVAGATLLSRRLFGQPDADAR